MEQKNIIFIGAGGFASECYTLLREIMLNDKSLSFKGFLSTSNDLEPYGLSHLFMGHYNDYTFKPDDYVVIAIGTPHPRKVIYESLKTRNVNFYTLIAPKAYVPNRNLIGEASIICPFVTMAQNVKLGLGNVVNSLSGIGHDAVIGNFNVFSSHTDICGFSVIGDENFFGSRVSALPHSKIGSRNKVSAGSIIAKRVRDNCVMMGNPARKICNIEEI